MKQRRLLEQALAECQDDHISSLLVRFIRANETVSCPKFDLAKIVAKDTDYHLSVFPGASGVLHKDGVITATNFAVVCCIEASYNTALEGKIVDPDGDIFECGFPEFGTIIPPD